MALLNSHSRKPQNIELEQKCGITCTVVVSNMWHFV